MKFKFFDRKKYWKYAGVTGLFMGFLALGIMYGVFPPGEAIHPNAAFLFTLAAIAFSFAMSARGGLR